YLQDWQATVLRANPDGSFRVALRFKFTIKGDGNPEQVLDNALGYIDLAPDGTFQYNESLGYRMDPSAIFPPLPKDAAAAKSAWEAPGTEEGARLLCKHLDGDGYCFEVDSQNAFTKVYLFTNKRKLTFDPARGLVTRGEQTSSQGWGIKSTGTGTLE